jgi:integrase
MIKTPSVSAKFWRLVASYPLDCCIDKRRIPYNSNVRRYGQQTGMQGMSTRKRTWKTAAGTKVAWLADYRDKDGKRRAKTFERKKDADAWLAQTKVDIKSGTHVPESASITLKEAADLWLNRPGNRERSTQKSYKEHVAHIPPHLGRLKLTKVDGPTCEKFKDHLLQRPERPLSEAMARKVMTSLRGILGNAQRLGYVGTNAAAGVKFDRSSRHKVKLKAGQHLPSKQEAHAMLNAAEGRWRPVLTVLLFCGLRASELRGLTWGAVDFEAKTLRVEQRANLWGEIGSPKSEAGQRTVPLSSMVHNALREWYLSEGQPKPDRLVFPYKGKIETHLHLWREIMAVQRDAGIVNAEGKAKYDVHSLRHWFASYAIELGFTPKRLQELLGHSSVAMTFDLYGHLFPSAEDDAAKFEAGERAFLQIVGA